MQALRRHGSNGLIVLGAVLEFQCRGPPIQLQQIITAADRLGEQRTNVSSYIGDTGGWQFRSVESSSTEHVRLSRIRNGQL